MRIIAPAAKVGFIVAAIIVLPMIGIALAAWSVLVGYSWALLALVALVIFTARVFRGPGEDLGPRPWWRMTFTSGWSWALCAVFAVQAVVSFAGSLGTPQAVTGGVGGTILFAIAAAYAVSATFTRALEQPRTQPN